MPRERAFCPVCRNPLPLRVREVRGIVPDGSKDAIWHFPGEVVRRSRPYAATVNGRREIVQTLHIWDGTYSAPWAPFCTTTCAARFGVQAARRMTHPALPAPEQQAPAEVGESRSLAARYGLLLEGVSTPEAAPAVPAVPAARSPAAAKAAQKYAEGTPGHPDWHPPGKPAPVPGVFRYDSGGYRIPDTPEYLAMKAAVLVKARAARAAKRAEGPRPHRSRKAGQVNGHAAP